MIEWYWIVIIAVVIIVPCFGLVGAIIFGYGGVVTKRSKNFGGM